MQPHLLTKINKYIFLSVWLIRIANDNLLESLNAKYFHYECTPLHTKKKLWLVGKVQLYSQCEQIMGINYALEEIESCCMLVKWHFFCKDPTAHISMMLATLYIKTLHLNRCNFTVRYESKKWKSTWKLTQLTWY